MVGDYLMAGRFEAGSGTRIAVDKSAKKRKKKSAADPGPRRETKARGETFPRRTN